MILLIAIPVILFLAFIFISFILVFKFTPAWVWLKAWWLRRPLIFVHYMDNIYDIKVGSKMEANMSTVKNLGPYELSRGSGEIERKTKMLTYHALTENSKTQTLWKAAIIKELREIGFMINKWADLKAIMDAATNNQWCREQYQRLATTNAKAAEKFKLYVKNIRRQSVDIFLNKSYKFNELYNLFPNDFSPVTVDEARTLAVLADRKKRTKEFMPIAIAIFILLLGFAVFYVVFKQQGQEEYVIKIATDTIKNNASILTG